MDAARNKAKQMIFIACCQESNRVLLAINAGGMQSCRGSEWVIAMLLGRRIRRKEISKYRAKQERHQQHTAANQVEIGIESRLSHDSFPATRTPRPRVGCRQQQIGQQIAES